MPKPSSILIHALNLLEASRADMLTTELDDILTLATEYAGVGILLKYDVAVVGENLQRVLLLNVHSLAKLHGDDNSAKLVDFSYDSG